ncbi:BTAD domain-containing putative transcriptional regulator [Rhodococcus jostii]|uniref:Tetratricopeptide repeat-containing protein n=1 Tax=Rhodococcus jostii TaxID=132919 RepID=A0A1H4YQW8_RHOJO|nr:BTAD domain-containing putative transcriptional regulator [Rhodococcus jostii]SED19608.1 Tetratricopeptide repeat-containing protein [Rhodococcus jostii]
MVRIRVLGTLEAEDEAGAVDLGGPRQRAVLALLLVARGAVVPVDRLVDDLWHGAPPPRAVGALQAYISNLRRALEPHRAPRADSTVLVSRAPGYALILPTSGVDAWEFENLIRSAGADTARTDLERALSLWRGPAFAEVAGEQWALTEIARLEELRVVARERLVTAALAAGDAAGAALDAQALSREHPLREEGWRLLALALHRGGRQADALAALREARNRLAGELGLDPGPGLTELERQILTGTVPSAPVPEHAGVPVDTTPSPLFLGRTEELTTLTALTTAPGTPVVLLGGDAGSGKSSLLRRFRRTLDAAGWQVAVGRCPEVDGAPPAWAWVEILRALRETVDPGAEAAALAPLLSDDRSHSARADAPSGRFLLHRAVADYLGTVRDHGPLAVVLDDVHRADEDTLSILVRLAQQRPPILLILAFRPDEVDAKLENCFADLASLQPTRIRLNGLGPEDSAELIRQVSGRDPDPDTLHALADRTGGNPFYLQESARLLDSEGELVATSEVPEGVRDVLRRRIARLPELAVSVLRLAAVVGRESDIDVLTRAAEVDEDTVFDALESGVIAGLLGEPRAGTVRFTHALVRDTLYSDLTRLRRSRWHARVGAALEELRPHDVAALAHHFTEALSATTARQALDHNVAAAAQAADRYAHDAEIGFLDNALRAADRLPPDASASVDERVELLTELSRTQLAAGSGLAGSRSRNRALAIARDAGRTDLAIRALAFVDTPTPWINRRYGAVDAAVVEQIETLLRDEDLEPAMRCRLLVTLVHEIGAEDHERTGSAVREAEALARDLDDPVLLGLVLSAVHAGTGSPTSTLGDHVIGDELLRIGDETQLPVFTMLGHHLLAEIASGNGDIPAIEHHMSIQSELADRYRFQQAQATRQMSRAMVAHLTGDLDAAEQHYVRGHELMTRAGLDADSVFALSVFTLRLTEGRVGELEPVIATIDSAAADVIVDLHALTLLANGKPDRAREVRRDHRPVRRDFFHSLMMSLRGIVVAGLGERGEAESVYTELSPYSGQIGGGDTAAFVVGPVDTILGDLALLLGRPEEARTHYAAALALAERCGCPAWVAAARTRVTTHPSEFQVDH